ncbi:Calycin-like protein [Anaeromyces robustus]|uniref:Calycin-like protein n=1 Tax=Anaeromyces robustus TaxID=1754192 RepID=A0A1Y1XR36_9FUNG|nr:Calycin-like protein [Anaeromyces robustus]|eukprot:ORX88208.1 Calycin-like protein [Anaeromyces robustus]
MRFGFISSLLLTASAAFAHSSGCAQELSKYNTCISAIDTKLLNSNNDSDIKTMCSKFNSNDCKKFLKDVLLTTTSCDIKNNHEKQDALTIFNLRIAYLKYCATDNSGTICPVSRHLVEDMNEHTHDEHTHDEHTHENTEVNNEHTHDEHTHDEHTHENTEVNNEHNHEKEDKNEHNHNHQNTGTFTEADIKPRELSEFNGKYQSVYPDYLTGDLVDYVVQQAEKKNTTFVEQNKEINMKWNCGVKYFEVNGNKITFIYDDDKEESAEYTYAGFGIKKNDKGEISTTRYKFETTSKNAPKYVMLNDHCHEPSDEPITHLHLHFGNESFDELMNSKIISFFVNANYTSEETREVLLGHDGYDPTLPDGEEVSTFDDEDVKDRTLSNWNGEWKSPYKYLLNGELDEVFEIKSKDGKKTAKEYKEYYEKRYKTDIDSVSINNNEVTFIYDDGKTKIAKYQYTGYYIQKWSSGTKAAMYRFENIDKKSDAPLFIEINDHMIKRAKSVHFHLRYTNTKWDDIDAENSWPTFFPNEDSIEDIIDKLTEKEHSHKNEEKEDKNEHNHNHQSTGTFTEADIKPRELSEFNGKYQSVYPYYLTGDLVDYVVQQAEKKNTTFVEQNKEINMKWNCGVKYFEVNDDKITFIYDDDKEESAEYTYAGFGIKKNDKGEISTTRYKFETTSKNAPKYVMLNDHCHEPSDEPITHLHLHFGNESFDELMNSKIISFFVNANYTSEETREVLLGHDGYDPTLPDGEEVSTFDDDEVKDRTLSNWNGKWKSPYKYLLNGELDEVFEIKSKDGKKTAKEYKEYYEKGYKTDIDSVSIKNNNVIFTYDDGKTKIAKYQYTGYYIQKWSSGTKAAMYRFENIDKESDAPLYIEINDHMIKRGKSVHFHLRYTNTKWDDIDAENNWPTFFPNEDSIEDIIDKLTEKEHSHKNEEKEDKNEHNHNAEENENENEHEHEQENEQEKEKEKESGHEHEHEHEHENEQESENNNVEEESQDDNDDIISDEINKMVNDNNEINEDEHEHAFYHDLIDDCHILECNQRFIVLAELLKLTDNAEAEEFEEFVKYYQKNNCDALQKLIEVNSGSDSIMKITFSLILTLLLSLIYLF